MRLVFPIPKDARLVFMSGLAALALLCSTPTACRKGPPPKPPIEPATSITGRVEPPEPVGDVAFLRSVPLALAMAASQGKPTMVYFHNESVPQCSRVEDDIFSDDRVGLMAGRFVSVFVNLEEDRETPKAYSISRYPTFLFLDDKGYVIHTVEGLRRPGEFAAEMQKALTTFNERQDAEEERESRSKE